MRRTGLTLLLALAGALTAGAQTQAPNTIATYAGGGTNTGAASNAFLPRPIFSFRDATGNTYVSVPALGNIYKITTTGTISLFAGNGTLGYSGDGGAATSAQLDYPQGMAFDSAGNLYIADTNNNRVRKVTPGGTITTVAGTGTEYNGAGFFGGYSGDGGQATDAFLNQPSDVAFDSSGNLYISDSGNNVVRAVNTSGVISTFAGNFNGGQGGYGGDGGSATSALMNDPVSVTTDTSGNLYISDENNCIVRKVDTSASHIITTYAGTPKTCGYGGDGAAATSALLSKLSAVRMDGSNNLYIADTFTNRIRKVDNTTSHDISTIAGTGTACTTPTGCGDSGTATAALLNHPIGVSVDSLGNVVITDSGDGRVRVVSSGSSPTIAAFAGGGTGGDGGAATSAILALPYIVKVDASGNVFVVDTFDLRVREVSATTHTITTVAGNGVRGVPGSTNGDGGQATSASFIHPVDLAIDGSGDLFILDDQAELIREVNTKGIISTVAGNGGQCGGAGNPNTLPNCGDGGLATNASLYFAEGMAVDSGGTIYVTDEGLNTIRTFKVGGSISTFAGTPGQSCTPAAYTANQCGDNGVPTSALLNSPAGVMAVPSIEFTGSTDVYFADGGDDVIRMISGELGTISTVAFNREPTFGGDGGSALDASMYLPTEIALDAHQNLFVGGGFDNIVRRIDNSGFSFGLTSFDSVETVAGDVDNLDGGFNGDGEASTKALLSNFGLTVDANNNLFVGDAGNNRIRIVPMAPLATWTPTTLVNFGTVLPGQIGGEQLVTFSNSGLNDLTVTTQSAPTDFQVVSSCPAPPLQSCDVFIEFAPPVGTPPGTITGNVVLATNDSKNPTVTFPVTGTVASSGVALSVVEVTPIQGAGIVISEPTGIDCPTTGCTATFATGTVVTLVAAVSGNDPGVAFVGWSGNCAPVTNVPWECTITMSAATTVTATFGAPSLTVGGFGNGSGVITSSPAGLNCTSTNGTTSGTCTATFPVGTSQVTLTATANNGSTFVGWSDFLCTNTTGTTCVLNTLDQLYTNEQAIAVFSVPRVAFTQGDVFLGATAGLIYEYHPNGTLVQILPSLNFNSFTGFGGGMMFDGSGNLYAANPNFSGTTGAGVETFASNGTGPAAFGGAASVSAGSVRIDTSGSGAVYVGLEANSLNGNLLKYNAGTTTAPSATYFPAYYANNGIFGFDIAHDNATMYYTVGGTSIYSYNFQLGLQNPDLIDNLPGPFAGDLRQLPDGTLLVADGDRVVRIDSTNGNIVQTYLAPTGTTFNLLIGLTLDANGTDFWTDDSVSGKVYKINISSGTIDGSFQTNLAANQFFGLLGLGGIAVYGSPASGGNDLTVDLGGLGAGTVTSSPAGISCPPTCTANFGVGSQVTLTAAAGTGSTFGGWSSNAACSGTGSCTITMSAAEAVTATFNTSSFALTVTPAGTGTGSVTSTPAGITCPSTCSANFSGGTVVTLTATPNSGSTFAGWSGAGCSGTGTCQVTMNAAESVTATFSVVQFPLTVTPAGAGTGTVTSSPAGITCPSTCSANFNSTTVVTLTATPGSGSTFGGWSGACTGTGSCVVTMNAAEAVTATFNTTQFALTVTKAGSGTGTVTSAPTGINCGTTCSANFASGTPVILTAAAGTGSTFAGWSGNAACSGTGTCTITMSAAESVTATFNTTTTFALTVTEAGTGTGSVSSAPAGITCPSTCSANYASGTPVTLTATPNSGNTFAGWSGNAACSGTGTCTITMSAAQSVTATFNTTQFALTVTKAGSGTGTVTSSPAGINCPTTCSANFNANASVVLTAAAGTGSSFTGWSGNAACSGAGTCTITMSAAESVTATFNTASPVTISVDLLNNGTSGVGTVTDNTGAINCTTTSGQGQTGTCSTTYATNTTVTFTETPGAGSVFTGWSNYPCQTGTGGTGTTCQIITSSGGSLFAGFGNGAGTFTLTTALPSNLSNSTGGGSVGVGVTGGGISCTFNGTNTPTGTCSSSEKSGAVIELIPLQNSNSTFGGYAGTCPSQVGNNCFVTMSQNQTVTPVFTAAQVTLSVSITGNGSLVDTANTGKINCSSTNGTTTGTCSATYTAGTTAVLTETPGTGYSFSAFGGSFCTSSTSTTCSLLLNAGNTYSESATFTINSYLLNMSTEGGSGTGTVTSNANNLGGTINCGPNNQPPSGCGLEELYNWPVTLTATPTSGSTFAGWAATGASGFTLPCTTSTTCSFNRPISPIAGLTVTATFTKTTTFALTVTDGGTGTGAVTSTPAGITCPSTCSASFASGTPVTLTASAGSGSSFAGWSGACSGTGSCVVTMNAAEAVTATFNIATTFALTVTDAGTGTGSVTSVPSGISCPSTCSANYASGTTVTLTATPASGSTFTGWSGNAACSGTGTCAIDMTAAESVTATFTATQFALSVTKGGSGTGTVTSVPGGINCGTACSANFNSGSTVTLTAAASSGSTFAGWSGAGCTGTGTCAVTMSAAESVTATFNTSQFALTVTEAGSGTGTVASSPTGISCPSTCSSNYGSGTTVTLTATAGSGSTFAGWSGQSGCGGTGTCTIDMTAAESVTATFTASSFTLTVLKAGTGTGTVVSSPQGINCGSGCSASFTSGTQVTLTATAGSGSTFAGWSGQSGCGGTGTCTIDMTAAESVTATFNNSSQFALTVTEAGSGTGTVVSSPAGISCPSTCSANYASGTSVTLTATAGSGSTFAGWSGQSGCGGTGTCTINMSSAQSVTATFNKVQFPLTVSLAGTGNGTVVSSPQGINCGSACTADFNSGSQVTLTATAGSGSSFEGWSGNSGCSGTGTCTITMGAAESVTATFNSGANFTFAPTAGTTTTVTTSPGGNIVVGLTVSGPVKETINLGCTSNAPQFLTCVITPTTVNLTGNGTTQVAIVLKSYCQGSTPGMPGGSPTRPMPPAGILGLLGLMTLLIGAMWSRGDRRRMALTMAAMLVLAVTGAACGGLPQGPNGATPAGDYVLTVTASATGQATQAVQINVHVN